MGIRERVQALHGEFWLESRPGEGLKVSAIIPVRSPGHDSDAVESDVKALAR
jgi:signal transduction histidine kinase